MNIYEAVGAIIGKKLADKIIADMGLDWAVVAAMAEARGSDSAEAIAEIRAWRAAQKAEDKLAALKRAEPEPECDPDDTGRLG